MKRTQVAESTPFDNETNKFQADNVQTAIEESRFSIDYVPIGTTLYIPLNKQNIVMGQMLTEGVLLIAGKQGVI